MGNHQKPDIRKALTAAKAAGVLVTEINNRHRWGEIVCAVCGQSETIAHTPRNPSVIARRVDEFVRRHQKH